VGRAVQVRGQAPVDYPVPGPGQDAHQRHDPEHDRDRVLLERPDQVEAVHPDPDLDDHDDGDHDELDAERVVHPEVAQDGDGEDHREVGVDPDPAHRHQELQPGRQVPAAAAEWRPREHHLVDAGLVAHHGQGGEDRAADEVADDDDQDRLREPEAEHDAERTQDPVDRRDVRTGPDPELLPARGVPVGLGNLLNRVGVEPGFAPRDVLCHL
jgi:hypothetical protein